MGASASDARAETANDDADNDIPRSPLGRRVEGEASLLHELPPVLAALVAEQERVGKGGQALAGFPNQAPFAFSSRLGDDGDDDEPDDGNDTVAKKASTGRPGRTAGSKNIAWTIDCEIPEGDSELA